MCGIAAVVALRSSQSLSRRSSIETGSNSGSEAIDSGYNSENGEASYDDSKTLREQLDKSLELINHRGPDSRNQWHSPDGKIALGHVRLSINDLSPDGEQPFHDHVSDVHVVVNGELYDSDRLRDELSKSTSYQFTSTSDSEVALALYKHYGTSFLNHLRGEFAVCVYDAKAKTFLAARDRYGVKPLFWTVVEGKLLIASEIKSFLPLGWKPKWDVKCLMDEGWRQDHRTPFLGVNKVRPGHVLTCDTYGNVEVREWWDMNFADKNTVETRSEEELVLQVREKLLESIRLRLRSDVPVGVYLSGGLDSSVVAGMVDYIKRQDRGKLGSEHEDVSKLTCFSIKFDTGSGWDESEIAERTAKHLGANFITKHMDEEAIADRFEDAVWHAEHQNYDLNFVGKFALSEAPREHGYKVVLTGEGADEVFGGYPAHLRDFLREGDPSWQSALSETDREAYEKSVGEETATYYSRRALNPQSTEPSIASRQLNNISSHIPMASYQFPAFAAWAEEQYGKSDPRDVVANNSSVRAKNLMQTQWHPLNSALYVWCKGNLSNVLLACLGDRAEMAHSIEGRVPFLDHELSAFVNQIPPSLKIKYDPVAKKFNEKWILREACRPFITDEIYERKKHGYAAPTKWPVGGRLHKMFQRLLTKENVEELGFIEWDDVKHLVGKAFIDGETRSLRCANVLAQWVVMSQRFGVERAAPVEPVGLF